ncbi:MAG: PrsW family intramembrane metalloprotease [Candidatus Pacebacteria bacterium]|nr:PrsW family intramembrane metalloprotease [Candidatus Paceibacterota bacterium]
MAINLMLSSHTFLIPLILGILPSLLWLIFWLREDKKNPEPRRLILKAFIGGMFAVIFVIPIQKLGFYYFPLGLISFSIVSITEELFKFLGAYLTALSDKENNEPLDPVIYMITAALGFAAVENTLFLFQEVKLGAEIYSLVISGNLRFIGATLLHVISSATVGVFMSISFYKKERVKKNFMLLGLIIAIVLHTVFNLLIINSINTSIFVTFTFVWIGVVILLLLLEKIKTIRPLNKK